MASLHFTNPEFLVLLVAIPLLILTHLYVLKFTKKKGMIFSNFDTLKRVTGEKVFTKNILVLASRILVVALVVLALAGPKIWYEGDELRTDYIIAIDTSGSMTATDITPNRFEGAKNAATGFVDSLNASAKVGVLGFSGTVTVEQPLTRDEKAVKDAVQRLKIRTISGTDISGALITGTNLLMGSSSGRAIILITDGSSTAGAFNEDPIMNGVSYAKEHRVAVHTIGIGSRESAPTGYLPRLYNVSAVFDEQNLLYIANQTGGQHLRARSDAELAEAYRSLASGSRSRLQEMELGFGLLLLALLLLFVEWGLTQTRYRLIP